MPLIDPDVGLMVRPAGKPVAPKIHESPLGKPLAVMDSGEIVLPAALFCVPGLVTDRTDTFQVKFWLPLPPLPSLAVTVTE